MTLAFLPLAPLLGALLVVLLRAHDTVAIRTGLAVLASTVLLSLWLVGEPGLETGWDWGAGFGIRLQAEGFGRIMAVLVPLIATPVALFASAAEGDEGGPRLLAWILAFVGAMEVLVLATDFLTLLIGWELVGACSWALIGYRWRDAERPAAASRAFLTTRFGDLGLYIAAAATFASTGSLDFVALETVSGLSLQVVAGGVLLAAAAKSAQLPFSPWLFSAMSGPTPASALLHSATMVAAGAYALVQLGPLLEPVHWFYPALIGVGLTTTLVGGVVASVQSDIKKALAASTSSQYGLMFVAVGVGSATAASAHLVTHATFKSLLFLGAGVAIHAAGTGTMDRMKLGSVLPWTGALMGAGALALAAVPPLGGAYSKEAVLAAAVHASGWIGAAVLVSGGITAFYAGRLFLLSYGPGSARVVEHPRRAETVALAVLAVLTVLLGLLWIPAVAGVAEGVVPGEGFPKASPWELPASLALVAGVGTLCMVLWRRGSLFNLGLPESARNLIGDWVGLPAAARLGLVRPTLRLARALADFDDRVVDGGVRAAVSLGGGVSRLLATWGEWGTDGVVEALANATRQGAARSRDIDDRVVDGIVEAIAAATGVAGTRARSVQTGLTHHYYAAVVVGLLVLVSVAVFWS